MLEFSKIFIFPYLSFGIFYLLLAYTAKKLEFKIPNFLKFIDYSHEHKWLFWIIAIVYLYVFYTLE